MADLPGLTGARLVRPDSPGSRPSGWPPLALVCITPPFFTSSRASQSDRERANQANPANSDSDQTGAPGLNPVALPRLIW